MLIKVAGIVSFMPDTWNLALNAFWRLRFQFVVESKVIIVPIKPELLSGKITLKESGGLTMSGFRGSIGIPSTSNLVLSQL